ncbi:MAG: endonuclease/exonuclease/phosphatase family protein [Bacteroidales bacterium]|nr:endonuclease/exonuclease/phosphatase family protein [Bacteroidales bacterium]
MKWILRRPWPQWAILSILHALLTLPAFASPRDSLLLVFWNVENLFDCDGNNGGKEWTPEGNKHWTPGRLRDKCNAIGKTLLWIGEKEGMLPDLVALAEVENDDVLKRLIYSDVLRKCGYAFVHFDSPDPRGIDVALLYRKERFPALQAETIPIPGFRTRDILRCLIPLPIDTLTLLINHHPSKLGGEARSHARREAVMRVLRKACLFPADGTLSPRLLTIATGDFNDTPDGAAFHLLDSVLVCLSRPLHQRGEGSLKYNGKWELIDHFWVSPDLAPSYEPARDSLRYCCATAIVRAPFLLTPDTAHAGDKPCRTYLGPRYIGGVSDHLPILLKILYTCPQSGAKPRF